MCWSSVRLTEKLVCKLSFSLVNKWLDFKHKNPECDIKLLASAGQSEEAETRDMLLLIYIDGKSFAMGSK